MKSFFGFLKDNRGPIFLVSFSVACSIVSGFSIPPIINKFDKWRNHELIETCDEAYRIMCVQVHACTKNSVIACDQSVAEQKLCQKKLPVLAVIKQCVTDLRYIECIENLPASCSSFM